MFKLKKMIRKIAISGFCLIACMVDQGISKVLKCPQVGILNIALADKLYIIARIKLAFKESSAVAQLLAADSVPKDQKTGQKDDIAQLAAQMQKMTVASKNLADQKNDSVFIKPQLERMIAPVKEFFTEIREFSALIEPLLKESIGGKPEQSHLYAFMQSEDDLLPFFEKRIQTREQLKAFALEFKMLFGDLHDSLSPEVIKKYEKFVADIKGKRPQGAIKN